MGTWGHTNFENDSASDWMANLEDFYEIDYLVEPLQSVAKSEWLSSDLCQEALAAAEVGASIWTRNCLRIPTEVRNTANQERSLFRRKQTLTKTDVRLAKSL